MPFLIDNIRHILFLILIFLRTRNMTVCFQLTEYKEILNNYTSFDYLKPLLKSIELDEGITSAFLKITWLEGKAEQVFVDNDGWYVIPDSKFPTFEALAMDRSKLYSDNWGDALNQRLRELDQDSD